MTQPPDAGAADAPLDPAAARAIIDAQSTRVRAGAYSDARLIFGVWAVAWSVGYGLLWATSSGGVDATPWWAWAVFGLLMASGVAATIVHSLRQMSGVAGVSRTTGAMYGWSWFVAFLGGQGIVGALAGGGLPDETVALLANGISALIVGIQYMAGGALCQDRAQFGLGIWMVLVAAVATIVGLPGTFAVMCLAGGGGMALGVLLAQLARRRGRSVRRGALA
jgi:hypothetical protein